LKQVEHPIYICHAVKEKSSSAEVAIADLGVATKSGRAANGTIKRKLVPSLTGSHLRDIERAWRRAIEVEIMSAAEGECLAGAECVSVYDPWGDIEGESWSSIQRRAGVSSRWSREMTQTDEQFLRFMLRFEPSCSDCHGL
jgi:hypothetical protein